MVDQAQSLREMVKKTEKQNQKTVIVNQPDQARPIAKVITITSGKGGVGKSSITVNLAIALSRLGLKVLVIDADFGLANIDVMLGMPVQYNLNHLLRGERKLTEIVQEGYGGIHFISGGSGINELLNMNERQLTKILDDLLQLSATFNIILIDTGAGVNDTVLRLMAASTETILVTTPEPTAILDAYALLKTISHTGDMPVTRLIMNKADDLREAENATNSLIRIAKKYLHEQIRPLGCILFDKGMDIAIKQQKPMMIGQPKSATAKNIAAIAGTLIDLPTVKRDAGTLSKLFSRLLGQS